MYWIWIGMDWFGIGRRYIDNSIRSIGLLIDGDDYASKGFTYDKL